MLNWRFLARTIGICKDCHRENVLNAAGRCVSDARLKKLERLAECAEYKAKKNARRQAAKRKKRKWAKSASQLVADCTEWRETPNGQRTKAQAQSVLVAAEAWQARAIERAANRGRPAYTRMPKPPPISQKTGYMGRLVRAAHLYCWNKTSKAHKVELIRVAAGHENTL